MQLSKAVAVFIEDELHIQKFVQIALEQTGWTVYLATTGGRGLIEVATRKPDVLILDLGLPDMSGLDVIKDIRAWSNLPIIVLSARDRESDKVAALDAGADDYLTKPFGIDELLARLRANLRRPRPSVGSDQTGLQVDGVFKVGNILINWPTRSVKKAGNDVHLTPIEYRLLQVLVANSGRVLTHRQILKEVWGPSYTEHTHYPRVYVGHLRQKLEDDPTNPRLIMTETAIGYRLVSG